MFCCQLHLKTSEAYISESASGTAAGVLAWGVERLSKALLIEFARLDQLERLELRALLPKLLRERRHRTGADATDVSVVGTRSRPEDNLLIVEGGHDNGQVGEVRSTSRRVVRQEDVALLESVAVDLSLVTDRVGHCTQVDWNVRSVGNQATINVEDGA
jgi:hypothetical protein